MLHLVIGNQGSGKTLFLVKKALEYTRQGITIYSNINFKGIRFKRLKYKDIIEQTLIEYLSSEIYKIAEEVGFILWDRAVMKLQGQTIKADPKAYYRALKNNYMVQTFDDILIFKKGGKNGCVKI